MRGAREYGDIRGRWTPTKAFFSFLVYEIVIFLAYFLVYLRIADSIYNLVFADQTLNTNMNYFNFVVYAVNVSFFILVIAGFIWLFVKLTQREKYEWPDLD